ncbi:MAG: hypothetical protein K2X27_16170 [Candidatus Obscuribacterales bacterium]|nr:hypothetical protein [Candidatus Obscuribacterales bacterium]
MKIAIGDKSEHLSPDLCISASSSCPKSINSVFIAENSKHSRLDQQIFHEPERAGRSRPTQVRPPKPYVYYAHAVNHKH